MNLTVGLALEFVDQVCDNPTTGSAEGMTDTDRSAVYIGFGYVQIQFLGTSQELCRKGLVDFPQIDISHLPADCFQQLLHSAHWRGGEPLRRLSKRGVADDAGDRLCTQGLGC